MNELSSRMRSLQEEYARRLPDKLDQLDELWHKLLYVDWRSDLLALMQRMAHNLAGSGRSFGFPEVSEIAAGLERFLQQCLDKGEPPSDTLRHQVVAAIGRMRSQIHGELQSAEAPDTKTRSPRPMIFVVDDDQELGAYLQLQLSLHGYQTRIFADIDAAIAAVAVQQPAAVLVDVVFPRSYRAGIDAVGEMRAQAARRIPVLFMSARTDMTARLEALRAGGDGYFTKPLDIDALRQKLSEVVLDTAESAHRVLVLEHDAAGVDDHCAALESVGMVCRRLRNGLQLIEEIVHFHPDLILMEYRVGELDGLELATAIRQDEQFVFTPIVFMVDADDPQLREQALRHGVDDVIAAKAPAAELAACVHERIHSAARVASRARLLSVRDPLTGTLNRRCFLERADFAVAGHAHAESRASMLYIAVDQVARLRRDLGAPCFRAAIARLAERVLEAVGAEDVVAYFGNGIFAILSQTAVQDTGLGEAVLQAVVAAPIQACGQSIRVTCSVGAATQEAGRSDGLALLLRAEQAAAAAQAQGGSRVCEFASTNGAATAAPAGEDPGDAVDRAVQARAFQLVYQPILRLHGEHEELYEALLRMSDDHGRPIPPQIFMPRLRSGAHMLDVDRWVIEHAIETLAADRRTRGRTRFFIKLSQQALGNRMLLMWISNCIRNSRLIGQGRIVFEAAESDVAAHLDQTVLLAQGLRQLHCALAVEHFGTSDQITSVLERVRPEYVKMQGGTAGGRFDDADAAARTQALVAQAIAAGAEVIVGQVEDTNTLALLWEMGVRYFQGYAVSSPDGSLDFDFQGAFEALPGGS